MVAMVRRVVGVVRMGLGDRMLVIVRWLLRNQSRRAKGNRNQPYNRRHQQSAGEKSSGLGSDHGGESILAVSMPLNPLRLIIGFKP